MGEMILCPHCAEYDIPDHSAITESERQDYEQHIKELESIIRKASNFVKLLTMREAEIYGKILNKQ